MISKVTADTPVSDEVKNHPGIRLCAGHCCRYTRGTSMTIEAFPNTVIRSVDGKCQKCLNDERRSNPEAQRAASASLSHTVTGLEAFMAKRRQRIGS